MRSICAEVPHSFDERGEKVGTSEQPCAMDRESSLSTARLRICMVDGSEATETIEESFYLQDFDPVRHTLGQIPEEGVDQRFIDLKVGQRMLQLDFLMEKLAEQVMENHEEMVKGMQLVMELEKDMQVSTIITKNGRRHLFSAMHEVSQDLVVSANVRNRQLLVEMLPILERVQHIIDLKARLETTANEGDYAKALQMCSECMLLLDSCSELSAMKEVNNSIEEWLQRTMDKVDNVLEGVCGNFQEEKFATVLDAYYVIDDIPTLAEKIQTIFEKMVVSETHAAVRELLYQAEDPLVVQRRSRLPYNELCIQVPEGKFKQGISKILEILFDIMSSYYQMMVWQHLSEAGTIQPLMEDCGNQAGSKEKNGSLSVVQEDNLAEDSVISYKQRRLETAGSVQRVLERGRKTLWELVARRVTSFLTCDAFFAISPHHFLQCLDWVNKFTLAGEAFCGSEATSLRTKLTNLSEKYFGWFNRQNLEVLRMMLEKETWQQLSPAAIKAVNLAGLTTEGPPLRGSSFVSLSKVKVMSNHCEILQCTPQHRPNAGFREWLKGGNPFVERHAIASHGSNYEKDHALPADLLDTSNVSTRTDGKQEEEEDDDDLLADFIDEESQLPSRLSSNCNRTHVLGALKERGGPEVSVVLTGSAVSFLRYIDRYVKLMHILQPLSPEIFKGICQLFELYFFSIFKIFGQQDAIAGAQGHSSPPSGMTARLRTAISRMSVGLEDCHLKPFESKSTSPGVLVSSEALSTIPGKPGSPLIMSASNLYALKERFVATESLMCLGHIMRKSRLRFQTFQPQDGLASIEQFFARTVDVVPDLRENVYRTVAKLLLNVGGYVDRIANVKWELKDLGLQHNGHMDLLLGEYKHFSSKLTYGGVSKEVHELLLEYGIDTIAEVLVEGLSRVKKCNNEGRALMSLDLQVLINGLQHLAPQRLKSNLQIVETYIKAFYLPETEYLYWIRKHPEYTKAQIMGLINLVASTNNWKRRSRLDLLEKVEAGDIYI